MSAMIVLGVLGIILFIASYITKRRFGILGLALATGYVLSSVFGYEAGLVAGVLGFSESSLTVAITKTLVLLFPPVALLFHGYSYKNKLLRLAGSLMFAIVSMVFLLDIVTAGFGVNGPGREILAILIKNKNIIIGFGMVVAIVDIYMTKSPHILEKKLRH